MSPMRAWTGLLLTAMLTAGCGGGPPLGQVKGTVMYRGKPVPNGTIVFVGDVPGPVASSNIEPDGSYRLTTAGSGLGAPLGSHKVMIVAMEEMKGVLPEARNPTPPPIVPIKYSNLATTDLRAEVKEGANTIDFDLKDAAK
jgi:hypothetical protein